MARIVAGVFDDEQQATVAAHDLRGAGFDAGDLDQFALNPPAPAAHVDRWQRMEEDMSHCTREDFISRVICGQRVRFKYCDGYWGKVPQCPASPPPERGQ